METTGLAHTTARVVTLHRSRRAVVQVVARAVLLPVCVGVLGQNAATMSNWSARTWIVMALLLAYVVGAFVELCRSFGPTDVALVDGHLVLSSPTLLRQSVWIPQERIVDARVTPRGWFGFRGTSLYRTRDTAALTTERPELGASVRAVVTIDAPIALPWRRIPGPRGDLIRGRSMPRRARHIVLAVADRDLDALRGVFAELAGVTGLDDVAGSDLEVRIDDRARDVTLACRRVALVACAVAVFPFIPHSHRTDPLRALVPGVCLDAPDAAATSVDVQPCTSPHSAEVVGITHEADAVTASTNDCTAQYTIYAGDGAAPTGVRVRVLRDAGSSDGVCVAVLPLFVTYSLHGAGTAI